MSEDRLRELRAAAEAELPGVHVDAAAFEARVLARGVALDALTEAGATELYLVLALEQGSRAALDAFEARYLARLGRRLGSVTLSDSDLDDVKQRAREKLLVPDAEGRVRLAGYAGEGRLAGLVRVVVTREALSLARGKRAASAPTEELVDPVTASWDPAFHLLEAPARAALRTSFEDAVKRLAPRDRTLLRLHLLGGVTLEKLAVMYGVHRATVVRWLAAARKSVLEETEKGVAGALGLQGRELASVLTALQSRLDLSVERMLATVPPDD